MILWRPVGLKEMALVFESGMLRFPPRLPEQPIFYPVLNAPYAEQIARDWNTKDPPHAGYVLRFEIPDDYAERFPPQTVGAAMHRELWVPAEELEGFNDQIVGRIVPERAFFGAAFRGHVPERFELRGKDAHQQIVSMIRVMDYSGMDFIGEMWTNALTIFLHFPFWKAAGAERLGVEADALEKCLGRMRDIWASWSKPQPAPLIEDGILVGGEAR